MRRPQAAKPGGTAKNSRPGKYGASDPIFLPANGVRVTATVICRGVFVLEFWILSFKEVSGRYDGPALETEVLEFWREHDVFQKTLDQTEGKPQFSFQ